MEFIILGGALVVGFFVGWHTREIHAMNKVRRILEEVEEAQDEEDAKADRLTLERHGEVVYAFDGSDTFLAQGSSLEELDDAIQARFPGRKFLIKESNIKEVGLSHDSI